MMPASPVSERGLALVPGWGMPASALQPLGASLVGAPALVDLPGHAGRPVPRTFDLDQVVPALLAELPRDGVWIGWSLGGQLLLEAARRQPPGALVLIATTPRFTTTEAWEHGVSPGALDQLMATCARDAVAAQRAFLGLLATGGTGAREAVRQLRARQGEAAAVDPVALAGGLRLLASLDQRDSLAGVQCPTLWVMGGRDPLMAASGADRAARRMPDAVVTTISDAGHAPFLSHPEAVEAAIESFLAQRRDGKQAYHDGR